MCEHPNLLQAIQNTVTVARAYKGPSAPGL